MNCSAHRARVIVFVSILACCGPRLTLNPARADPPTKGEIAGGLTSQQKELLDGLLDDFLFDPKNTQRVRVKVRKRTVHTRWATFDREGWLVDAEDGSERRIFFTDRTSIAAPAENDIEQVDFLSTCKARFADERGKADTPDEWERKSRERFRRMRRAAMGDLEEPDLALAAWLYRIGQGDLAARALARAEESASLEDKTATGQLKSDLGLVGLRRFSPRTHGACRPGCV